VAASRLTVVQGWLDAVNARTAAGVTRR
jgi:hypothetical protein